MTSTARCRVAVLCSLALVSLAAPAFAQGREPPEISIELVDPKVLRVCADPHNLPFSNDKGEGLENKLAELFAAKLDKKVAYTFFPQATGFVRMTLGSHRCDVIMGFPQGDDLAQSTNPYYRTAYALIYKAGGDLEGLDRLSDERLKQKRIGVVAGTPPATYLAANALLARARPYALVIDTRFDSSAEAMVRDLKQGEIDVGILWGPMAGYFTRDEQGDVRVVPLLKDSGGPRLSYRIGMGVRSADQNWKRQLNRLIQENQPEINRILLAFGVPLLDEKDQPITAESIDRKP